MREAVKLFKALSDPNRLRILMMLKRRRLCVCEIQSVLDLAPSTVSKHLSILRDTGLILDEKEGKWVHYYINPQKQETAEALFVTVENMLRREEIVREDAKKVKTVNKETLSCKV